MSWLVTGGAGYIGSHIVKSFIQAGMTPVVLDDFSTGHREFLAEEVEILEGSLLDENFVAKSVTARFEGVIHLAGYKYAGESVKRPLHTYKQNVEATVNLLSAMESQGIKFLVFSSSAAVYGTPSEERVTEDTQVNPESPYGESKLIGEWLVRNQFKSSALNATSLRYFNVVGSGSPGIVDLSPFNLFPLLFRALSNGQIPHINGDDFPTPDGTCVRDYVHVEDVAAAHVSAAKQLSEGIELSPLYNLGAGTGTSVAEIMTAASRVTGIAFNPEIRKRRLGDPARIVADGTKASIDLGWKNSYSIDEMLETAWSAWNNWSN